MKKIRELNTPTPGLAEYLNLVETKANWEEFYDHNQGAFRPHKELIEKLIAVQHGLCGYCEIDLTVTEMDRQIEHVIPRSDPQHGTAREVDVTNMIACCKGGTSSAYAPSEKSSDEDRYRKPVRDNMSCGQAKGDRNEANFLDPRKLPALPSLTKVLRDGRITVDEKACESEGIPVVRVRRTIEILNLNAERLRLVRTKYWNELVEQSKQYDDPDKMNKWIQFLLTPNENGQLTPFFTTNRSYFGPLSESILAQQPQTWI